MNNGDLFDGGGTAEGRIKIDNVIARPTGGSRMVYRISDGMRIDGEYLDLDTWYHVAVEYPEVGRWARIKAGIKRWINHG